MVNMTRTCAQCIHFERTCKSGGRCHGVYVHPDNVGERYSCFAFNAPTGLRWVPEFDVIDPSNDLSDCVITSWQLVRANAGMQSRPGFVSPYADRWLAMYSQPCLRWYREVGHGDIRACARALIARVKGETDG